MISNGAIVPTFDVPLVRETTSVPDSGMAHDADRSILGTRPLSRQDSMSHSTWSGGWGRVAGACVYLRRKLSDGSVARTRAIHKIVTASCGGTTRCEGGGVHTVAEDPSFRPLVAHDLRAVSTVSSQSTLGCPIRVFDRGRKSTSRSSTPLWWRLGHFR